MRIKAGATLIQMNVAFRVVLWWQPCCVQKVHSGIAFVLILVGRNNNHQRDNKKRHKIRIDDRI